MIKDQKSRRNGIQDFLCPFTDMYITQGSNGQFSHRGTMANDVRGIKSGVKYPYYAPCDVVCLWTYYNNGQSLWQSKEKVRFANGRIDYATFMICHDNTIDCYVGMERKQGQQIGNMGNKGGATGVHCHIEIAQAKYNMNNWHKNKYGIWCFDSEYDTDESYFVDNTNIINGMGGNWKKTTDVPVSSDEFINVPPSIVARNVYFLDSNKIKAQIKPQKFGGLSYRIISRDNTYATIDTLSFGRVRIKITQMTPITKSPQYKNGTY